MKKIFGWLLTAVGFLLIFWGWMELLDICDPFGETKWNELAVWQKPVSIIFVMIAYFVLWIAVLAMLRITRPLRDDD